MTFDEALELVRGWIGKEVAVAFTLNAYGPGTGWLADNSGRVARIDDPIPEVDQPVHYVRFEDGPGFALARELFQGAEWDGAGHRVVHATGHLSVQRVGAASDSLGRRRLTPYRASTATAALDGAPPEGGHVSGRRVARSGRC